jgi:hypothetical protein
VGRPPGNGKKKKAPSEAEAQKPEEEQEKERRVVVWLGLEGEATWKESIPESASAEEILGIIKARHRLEGVYDLRTRNHGVEEEFRVASNLEYRAMKREFLPSSTPDSGRQQREFLEELSPKVQVKTQCGAGRWDAKVSAGASEAEVIRMLMCHDPKAANVPSAAVTMSEGSEVGITRRIGWLLFAYLVAYSSLIRLLFANELLCDLLGTVWMLGHRARAPLGAIGPTLTNLLARTTARLIPQREREPDQPANNLGAMGASGIQKDEDRRADLFMKLKLPPLDVDTNEIWSIRILAGSIGAFILVVAVKGINAAFKTSS